MQFVETADEAWTIIVDFYEKLEAENAAAAVNRLAALRTEGEAATRDLMQSTERVLAAQTELQAAMSTLDATGLSRLFTHMVNRLEKVSDVLEGFRQPMVLQAIPLRMADGLPPAASEPESQALGPATAPGP